MPPPCGLPAGKAASLLPPEDDNVVGIHLCLESLDNSSLPVSKHCCWYPQQRTDVQVCVIASESCLWPSIMQRGFLCVSFTSSFLALWQRFQPSPLGLDIILCDSSGKAKVPMLSCRKVRIRGKDPISTPTCSTCFKPGLCKKDTCVDLQSHVPESELPRCFAFASLGKSNVSATDTAPVREEPAQSLGALTVAQSAWHFRDWGCTPSSGVQVLQGTAQSTSAFGPTCSDQTVNLSVEDASTFLDAYRLGHLAVEVLVQTPPLHVQSGHSKVRHKNPSCAMKDHALKRGKGYCGYLKNWGVLSCKKLWLMRRQFPASNIPLLTSG